MDFFSENTEIEGPREIEFFILNDVADIARDRLQGRRSKGSLLEMDKAGMSMMTKVFLQPGDVIEVEREGEPSLGIVMWSILASNTCRIQVRFVEPNRTA